MLNIAGHSISFHEDLTVTRIAGKEVHAVPHHTQEYLARAQSLGYGDALVAMSRDHEVTHALLAKWLGLHESPTLKALAHGGTWHDWQKEEAAVLAIQAFANAVGVNLTQLAMGTHK